MSWSNTAPEDSAGHAANACGPSPAFFPSHGGEQSDKPGHRCRLVLAKCGIEACFGSFDIRNSTFGIRAQGQRQLRLPFHSTFGFRHSSRLAPHGMAGRCKVRVQKSKLRSIQIFNSTFEIQHSPFASSSNQSGEGDIRRALIEADLVDCMVALPSQLFTAMENFNVDLAA